MSSIADTDRQLAKLNALAVTQPLHVSGALSVPSYDYATVLFGGTENSVHRIDFAKASPAQRALLELTCVSGALSASEFTTTTKLHEAVPVIVKSAMPHLVDSFEFEEDDSECGSEEDGSGDDSSDNDSSDGGRSEENGNFRHQLVSLLACGPSGEARHCDPDPDAFARLFIHFPSPHEGGAIVLRRADQEAVINDKTFATLKPSLGPHIRYSMIPNDTAVEIQPISAGQQIILCYNIFKEEDVASPTVVTDYEAGVRQELRKLLNDATFLPGAGVLAFGLVHRYFYSHIEPLEAMLRTLKGKDASILAAAAALGLAASPMLVYRCHDADGNERMVLLGAVANFEGHVVTDLVESLRGMNGRVIDGGEGEKPEQVVHWVTPLTERTRIESAFVADSPAGPTLDWVYGIPCLIVWIGPASTRETSTL